MNAETQFTPVADALVDSIRSMGPCAVAFSGGVDSAVVANAAYLAMGQDAIALTAVSPSLAERELVNAKRVANAIGIQHRLIETNEISLDGYRKNAGDRCYYCKTELYRRIQAVCANASNRVILNGTNIDDLGDHRPGLIAANEHHVRSPMVELGIDKAGVRRIAAHWGLEVANKPASPCLSSRIAYGEEVTIERLKQIERAEDVLQARGFNVVRVRYLTGAVARIEVPLARVSELQNHSCFADICHQIGELGFSSVHVDERGFQSGRLNEALSEQTTTAANSLQTYQIKTKSD